LFAVSASQTRSVSGVTIRVSSRAAEKLSRPSSSAARVAGNVSSASAVRSRSRAVCGR